MSQHKHTWMVIVENERAIAICMTDALDGKNIITAEQLLSGDIPKGEICKAELDQMEIERRLNELESRNNAA